jgi:hypothetical protein
MGYTSMAQEVLERPDEPMTKSRSGAAQAKKPAATRRGVERGGASVRAVARAISAPESAWVRVSI